jgi:VanZ family protein
VSVPAPTSLVVSRLASLLAAVTLAYVAVLVFATHYPKPEDLIGTSAPSDKTLHFLAYGTLGLLATATLAASGRWSTSAVARLAAGLAAFGVVDEVTQPYFGRNAEALDWVFDCIGIGGGLLAVVVVVAIVKRLRQ